MEIETKFIYGGKVSELKDVLEHGINLYRYDKETKKYEFIEIGKLFYCDDRSKFVVTGKCDTKELEIGDIIEHDKRICEDGISRYDRA